MKSTKEHQRISIIEICDESLQSKVDEQFNQWKESIMLSNSKILQRDIDQTRQNIMYNVLIDALKERGNIIESYEQKKSMKVISRRRISSYNGMKQEETRRIGEEMNRKILEKLPIEKDMKKKESAQIIWSLESENNPEMNSIGNSQIKYLSQQTMQVMNINGLWYSYELMQDINGNSIAIIPFTNEDGNIFYYNVVYNSESNQYQFIPCETYQMIQYQTVSIPVINYSYENSSNE